MRYFKLVVCLAMLSGAAGAQILKCNLDNYKPIEGVRAEVKGGAVTITWDGEAEEQLMAEFTLRDGQPVVTTVGSPQGWWTVDCAGQGSKPGLRGEHREAENLNHPDRDDGEGED